MKKQKILRNGNIYMKRSFGIALVFISLNFNFSAQAKVSQDFEFKGIKAGVVSDISSIGVCAPKDSNGVVRCEGSDDKIASLPMFQKPEYKFVNGKLSNLRFITGSMAYPILLSAFTQKYGPSCESKVEKWQNRLGAAFDNNVVIWCFRTGKLELRQRGLERDILNVWYGDVANPLPSPQVKVDF